MDLMTGLCLSTPGMIVRSPPLALTLHRLLVCPLWMSSGISFVCVWVNLKKKSVPDSLCPVVCCSDWEIVLRRDGYFTGSVAGPN